MKIRIKVFLALFIILTSLFLFPTANAQKGKANSNNRGPTGSCSQDPVNPRHGGGIITSPGGGSGCSSDTGVFAFDEKIKFLEFRIPTYADLQSKYFDQSKAQKITLNRSASQADLQFNINPLIYVQGDSNSLNLSGNPATNGVGVVFVDGNLNFNQNYTYGTGSTGTVFVVKGDINIAAGVTNVDGILVSSGTIYTAGAGCVTSDASRSTPRLTVNGSLIALDATHQIRFCRNLGTNNQNQAAEVINHQVKYAVILKDLFSETLQKWSEIP